MDAARAAEAASCPADLSARCTACLSRSKTSTMSLGSPTSMGSLAAPNRVPKTSAAAVERLIDAGAIVLGKTNTPEFGHKGITDNLRFGPTSTPWKIGYNSGGSSGGSAAAVADGMAALAQGTDGGGSVRIPAAFSGVVGFKPSFGRSPFGHSPRRLLVGPSAGAHRAPRPHSRRRRADDLRHGGTACGRSADAARRWRRLLARRRRYGSILPCRLQSESRRFPGR